MSRWRMLGRRLERALVSVCGVLFACHAYLARRAEFTWGSLVGSILEANAHMGREKRREETALTEALYSWKSSERSGSGVDEGTCQSRSVLKAEE